MPRSSCSPKKIWSAIQWSFLCVSVSEWVSIRLQAVDPFLSAVLGDKAAAVNEAFLGRCVREIASKDVEELEDNEGEDLCNCEFSLAYGGKILLSNTRLWLKRGRRYGLCGANGTGKVRFSIFM